MISFFVVSSFSSFGESFQTGDFLWAFYEGTECQILGYVGAAEKVSIPDEIEGLPVSTITSWNSKKAKEIIFPYNVKAINKEAFRYCNISIITFPKLSKLKTIDKYAFANNNIESISLPKTAHEIYVCLDAFAYNPIKNLVVGENWDFANYSTKENTSSFLYDLEYLEYEEGETVVSSYAFENCKKLKKVVLSKSIQCIGPYAFYNCISLSDFYIPEDGACSKRNDFKNNHQFYRCPFDFETIKRLRALRFQDDSFTAD